MGGNRGGGVTALIGHLALALLLQLLVVAATRSWWGGAFTAGAWAVAREITQAEYRWIEHHGGGARANMPWWGGFDPIVWQKADPWLDWIAPTVFAVAIALIATRRRHSSGPAAVVKGRAHHGETRDEPEQGVVGKG